MTTPTAAVPEDKGKRRAGFASNAREGSVFLLRYGMVFVLIVMVVVTIILDSSFLDKSNLLNLLLQWAPVGLMAIGMTYVIIAGGFDLSVGGIYAGAAVLYAGMANNGFPIVLAVLLALLAGVGAGVVNGTIITGLNVNAFVATLGTGFMLRGLALVLTSAAPIVVDQSGFDSIGAGKWGSFPIAGFALIAALVIFGFILVADRIRSIDLCDWRKRRSLPPFRLAHSVSSHEYLHAVGFHGGIRRDHHRGSARLGPGRHRRGHRA